MTLTEAVFWTKRAGVIVGIAGVVFVVIAIIVTSINSEDMPEEYLTASCACTETAEEFLPYKLEIPSLEVNSSSENVFEVQTDTGKINDLSSLEIINVYLYEQKEQQLDSQIQAKEIASALGFAPEEMYRNGTTSYIWRESINSRSLEINAKTLNFNMTTDSEYIRDVAKENELPTESEAIALAKNAIRRLEILGSDYNYTEASNIATYLIDINPDNSYSEASSLSEAELIRVDFHKTKAMISIKENIANSQAIINTLNDNLGEATEDDIIVNDEQITVYNYSTIVTYANTSSSNISVYIGPEDENSDTLSNVYRINFTYWPIETESCGTYELVSPAYALDKVQEGEGSLVYLNEINGDEIEDYEPKTVKKYVIYDIDIAYYESSAQPTFLQPIYIISGETVFQDDTRGEFHIFYPAINYDIVHDKIEIEENTTEEDSDSGLLGL